MSLALPELASKASWSEAPDSSLYPTGEYRAAGVGLRAGGVRQKQVWPRTFSHVSWPFGALGPNSGAAKAAWTDFAQQLCGPLEFALRS